MTAVGIAPERVPWRAVIAFVVIACGLAWAIVSPLWFGAGLASPAAFWLVLVMMYTPAVSALLVVLLVQRPRPVPVLGYLGIWPLRPAGRTIGFTALALVGAIVLVVVAALLAGALGFVRLDLVHLSGFAAYLAARVPGRTIPLPLGVLLALQLVALPANALLVAFATFGEELGWRGWLVPSLRPLGRWSALLISGAVWGVWHAPILLLGYEFGLRDVRAIGLMVVATVLVGTVFGWLRLRTGSVWPSTFAHAGVNASGNVVFLLSAANGPHDLVLIGPLGVAGWIVAAVVVAVLAVTGRLRKEGLLQRSSAAPASPH